MEMVKFLLKSGANVNLVTKKIIDKNYKVQYYAPTVAQIINFMENHISQFTLHGRVIIEEGIPNIIIEGFYCTKFIDTDKQDFIKFCSTSNILRCIDSPQVLYNRW